MNKRYVINVDVLGLHPSSHAARLTKAKKDFKDFFHSTEKVVYVTDKVTGYTNIVTIG